MATARGVGASELDDMTLVRAQRGDEAARRALVVTYQKPVHALLWRMLSGGHRVDDLSQETFVRVFGALGRFSPSGPARLSTWILTIATRLALNEIARRAPAADSLAEVEEMPGGTRPDREAERRQLGARIRRALDELKPEYRAVVLLREYHDLEYDEIARALEIDAGTVKSRLSRGRAALREALGESHVDG